MAFNLKNREVEALAAEAAAVADEPKTEAIRNSPVQVRKRSERAASILQQVRDTVPAGLLGQRLSREEEDEILGFGPGGV